MVAIKGPFERCARRTNSAIYFGTTRENRFDDPSGKFGVLYAGDTEECAFIETFGARTGVRVVTRLELEARKMSTLEISLAIELVDLDGPNLAKLGADSRLFAGDHSQAQRWARAFYDHPDKPFGIRYPARHDQRQFAVALFDRCNRLIVEKSSYLMGDAANANRVAALLDRYGFGIL